MWIPAILVAKLIDASKGSGSKRSSKIFLKGVEALRRWTSACMKLQNASPLTCTCAKVFIKLFCKTLLQSSKPANT